MKTFLDGARHAEQQRQLIQRAGSARCSDFTISLGGFHAGIGNTIHDHRIEHRIDLTQTRDMRFNYSDGRDLAGTNARGQLQRGLMQKIRHY